MPGNGSFRSADETWVSRMRKSSRGGGTWMLRNSSMQGTNRRSLMASPGEGCESDSSSPRPWAETLHRGGFLLLVRLRLRKSYSRSPAAAVPAGAHRRAAEADVLESDPESSRAPNRGRGPCGPHDLGLRGERAVAGPDASGTQPA